MAINIRVYANESLNDFTKAFEEDDKLDTGSLNAAAAACAAAIFARCAKAAPECERQEYLVRNAEILRTYFLHLVDDDLKARSGYRKELKNGDPDTIEAAVHPACTINEEIINMLHQMMDLGLELKEMVPDSYRHYLKEMAEISLGIVKSCIAWLLNITSACSDETYKFVVKRENEITLSQIMELYEQY